MLSLRLIRPGRTQGSQKWIVKSFDPGRRSAWGLKGRNKAAQAKRASGARAWVLSDERIGALKVRHNGERRAAVSHFQRLDVFQPHPALRSSLGLGCATVGRPFRPDIVSSFAGTAQNHFATNHFANSAQQDPTALCIAPKSQNHSIRCGPSVGGSFCRSLSGWTLLYATVRCSYEINPLLRRFQYLGVHSRH